MPLLHPHPIHPDHSSPPPSVPREQWRDDPQASADAKIMAGKARLKEMRATSMVGYSGPTASLFELVKATEAAAPAQAADGPTGAGDAGGYGAPGSDVPGTAADSLVDEPDGAGAPEALGDTRADVFADAAPDDARGEAAAAVRRPLSAGRQAERA